MAGRPTAEPLAEFFANRYGYPDPVPWQEQPTGPGTPAYGPRFKMLNPIASDSESLAPFVPNEYWNELFRLQGPGEHDKIQLPFWQRNMLGQVPEKSSMDHIMDFFKSLTTPGR